MANEFFNEATRRFISEHIADDVNHLALSSGNNKDIDLKLALNQIAGWQAARRKLPSWAALEGVVFPPHINMEQCSSEFTATYKQRLVLRLCQGRGGQTTSELIDLTGGFGVDFAFMSQVCRHGIYVERDVRLCAIARHNFRLLKLSGAEVVNADSREFIASRSGRLPSFESADNSPFVIVFADPARRDMYGRKMVSIADCEPNVIEMLGNIMSIADVLIIKLSPMLDWREAAGEVDNSGQGAVVGEVHIVSVKNECKELLLVISRKGAIAGGQRNIPKVYCVNDSDVFISTGIHESENVPATASTTLSPLADGAQNPMFLYEPNASIMKAGCFNEVAKAFSVSPVSANSHLFVSTKETQDFPGRKFRIMAVTSMNKKELKAALAGIDCANVAVRNFPMPAAALARRLKVRDGGDVYIFGTTLANSRHILIITKKLT